MTEITACIRQNDINRISMTHKRPLSIIREYDSDDPDAADFNKCKSATKSAGQDTTTKNAITSTCRDDDLNCLLPESTSPPACTESVLNNETSAESSTLTSKLQSTKVLQSLPPSKCNIRQKIQIPKLFIPSLSDSRITETTNIHRSPQIPNDNTSENTGEDIDSSQHSETARFSRKTNSRIPVSKQQQQHNLTSAKIKNGKLIHLNSEHNNSQLWSAQDGDGLALARIKEAAERLQLTSSLTTSSSSLLPSHRLWTQNSTPKIISDIKSPTIQNLQQISFPVNGTAPILFSLTLSSPQDNDNVSCSSDSKDINDSTNINQSSRIGFFSSPRLKSSKLSAYFARRMSNESVGSESDLSDAEDSNQPAYLSDFRRLQETAEKLRLSTRRPSTMLWRQQYVDRQDLPEAKSNQNLEVGDERLTSDRKQKIDQAIEWLRNELQEMRSQDQLLARQLLAIRYDIHKLKLQRSTEEHQELIDDFQSELEELQEFSDFLDLPVPEYGTNPLKHIGVTRLNISARRFSAC